MRALVVEPANSPASASRLNFRNDYPQPLRRADEALIRVRMAGVCGTDLELARGYMGFSGVPGHEFVGEVAEGPEHLVGRRVVGEINAACGSCDFCRQGLGRHCPTRTVLGILKRDGAFADYLTLPIVNLLPVPDSVADESAVFTEPLAAAFEIFEQVRLEKGWRVAVLGDGRLGAMVAMALRARGFDPIVSGHHRDKLARLAALGFRTSLEADLKPAFDLVVEASGSGGGLARALSLVRARGKIILKTTRAEQFTIDLAPAVINEIEIVGSRCGRFAPALEALATGQIDPRSLIDLVVPLDQFPAAFSRLADRTIFKILLRVH